MNGLNQVEIEEFVRFTKSLDDVKKERLIKVLNAGDDAGDMWKGLRKMSDDDIMNLLNNTDFIEKILPRIAGKFRFVPRDTQVPGWMQKTFKDSNYITIELIDDLDVYRIWGGPAKKNGAFTTTENIIGKSKAIIKDKLAIEDRFNSFENISKITIPKHTEINIGITGPLKEESTDIILNGGWDQILMPQQYDEGWIKSTIQTKF